MSEFLSSFNARSRSLDAAAALRDSRAGEVVMIRVARRSNVVAEQVRPRWAASFKTNIGQERVEATNAIS